MPGLVFTLYVRIPRDPFEIIDVVDADGVVQPFVPGTLFADALQLSNSLVPEPLSREGESLLIRYAAVLGPAGSRSETGSGVLATFRLQHAGVIRDGEISLHSDPVYETLLVSPDGRGERHFYLDRAIDVTVSPETSANPVPTAIQPRSGALSRHRRFHGTAGTRGSDHEVTACRSTTLHLSSHLHHIGCVEGVAGSSAPLPQQDPVPVEFCASVGIARHIACLSRIFLQVEEHFRIPSL